MSLAKALQAIDKGDDEKTLAALLDAWRTSRAPRIAELVEIASERAGMTLEPPGEREWNRVDAAMTDNRHRQSLRAQQLAQLARFPDDPRLARLMVAELAMAKWVSTVEKTNANVAVLVDTIVRQRDPRSLPELEALHAKADRMFRRPLASKFLKQKLADGIAELRDAKPGRLDAKACDRIAERLASAAGATDALFAEVYASGHAPSGNAASRTRSSSTHRPRPCAASSGSRCGRRSRASPRGSPWSSRASYCGIA
jgi:hypothetical protein